MRKISVLFIFIFVSMVPAFANSNFEHPAAYESDAKVIAKDLVWAFEASEDDDIFEFNNKIGKVTFNHTKHQEIAPDSCSSCHPPFEMEYNDEVSKKELAHTTCKNCHTTLEMGPTKCMDCHIK